VSVLSLLAESVPSSGLPRSFWKESLFGNSHRSSTRLPGLVSSAIGTLSPRMRHGSGHGFVSRYRHSDRGMSSTISCRVPPLQLPNWPNLGPVADSWRVPVVRMAYFLQTAPRSQFICEQPMKSVSSSRPSSSSTRLNLSRGNWARRWNASYLRRKEPETQTTVRFDRNNSYLDQ